MRFFTPLRYPGGKSKLAYYVIALLEENNLIGGHYIEPFAGGAGVALQLLLKGQVASIHINDFDPAVYAFWKACTEQPDALCQLIQDTPVTMQEWHKQREIMLNPNKSTSLLEQGFATFFINRTNRSGILTAGVIGGKAQAGKWKLTERFNKTSLIKRIRKIANFADSIEVTQLDAAELLNKLTTNLPEKSLIYLDPPYYLKGQELYRNFYEHNDHVNIANKMRKIKNLHWIVSYDNNIEIANIYKDYRQKVFDLQYTAQQKRMGSEIMIFGDSIKIPKITLGKAA